MKQKNTGILMIVALTVGISTANAETCIPTTFNVTYSCNGGTLSGTLPSNTTATYGTSFSPTAITESMCTAPSGYVYGGQAIIVDGETVAYYSSTSAQSFTYYYTTDIEIGPHWVPVADPDTLASHLGTGGRTYTRTSGASGTWTAYFYYGAVSGVSKCVSVAPENTAEGRYTGLIADYDTIENASAGGQYCYCKMTKPYIAASPWVFSNDHEDASYCVYNCSLDCGYYVPRDHDNGRQFRASVFAGAMAE